MRHLLVFLMLTVMTTGAAHAALTVRQIQAELTKMGPRRIIDHYFDCENGTGYRLVASGDRDAVQLGVRLLSHADACVSERLESALGEAMTKQPEHVLPYVGTESRLSPQNICLPFVSSDEPSGTLWKIKAQARHALERVHNEDLARQKALCWAEITR
jgi:hypothetical protein